MATQRAIVQFTAESLAEQLSIGGFGHRLSYSFEYDSVLLSLSHPSLRYVREGAVSPRISLEQARELLSSFGFGEALRLLKAGRRVQREGWNGKGMWLALEIPDEHSKMTLPYIFMSTAQGDLVPWLASQTDILADDWRTAE